VEKKNNPKAGKEDLVQWTSEMSEEKTIRAPEAGENFPEYVMSRGGALGY